MGNEKLNKLLDDLDESEYISDELIEPSETEESLEEYLERIKEQEKQIGS